MIAIGWFSSPSQALVVVPHCLWPHAVALLMTTGILAAIFHTRLSRLAQVLILIGVTLSIAILATDLTLGGRAWPSAAAKELLLAALVSVALTFSVVLPLCRLENLHIAEWCGVVALLLNLGFVNALLFVLWYAVRQGQAVDVAMINFGTLIVTAAWVGVAAWAYVGNYTTKWRPAQSVGRHRKAS